MPLFGEVVQRMPALQRSGRFIFFAPHASEHLAIMPLVSELSERMGKAGIKSETRTIDGMRESLASISSKLSRIWRAGKERETLEKLFTLKDAMARLDAVADMLTAGPESVLVEMHALDRDYDDMDGFGCGRHYYRIPDTRILYARDYMGEYESSILQGLEALAEGRGKAAIALKEMLALDITQLVEETPRRLEMLDQNSGRTMLVEIPAQAGPMPEGVSTVTAFEAMYGYMTSLRHTLRPHEIDMALAALAR